MGHKLLREGPHGLLEHLEGVLNVRREGVKGFDDGSLLSRGESVTAPKTKGQQQQIDQHGGEGLGGRHAHFRACFQHEGQIRLAHHGARRHVAEGQQG